MNEGLTIGNLTNEHLRLIDLHNNQIPYIDTLLFVNTDGTSRFPNLKLINLANNSLVTFDLMFPLTIPSPNMVLDASHNPIRTLENNLGLTYDLFEFSYAVVNNRSVDLTGNLLTRFDDSILLQYGLYSEADLQMFLYKISNYDLRQMTSGQSLINCSCPLNGQLTSQWYARLLDKNMINTSTVLYQLHCSNIGNDDVFVLNFNCTVSFFFK